MEKIFIVVERIEYEGYTIMRAFSRYSDAAAYSDELTANNTVPLFEYDVLEREVY